MKRIKTRWYGTVIFSLLFMSSLFLGFGTGSEVKAAVTLRDPMVSGDVTTWDCVWFGSYPQTEILPGNSVYNSLQSASGWDVNDELTINGVKYRRLRKSYATSSSKSGTEGYYNWENTATWHYFRYEPIKWRVLETGGNMFLMADKAIDTKQHISEVNWSQSSIRSFLNSTSTGRNGFMGTAFTAEQQNAILETDVKTKLAVADGNVDTRDRIYLLDTVEINYNDKTPRYGFTSKSTRKAKLTDYASAMGSWSDETRTCGWWLRRYMITTNGYYNGIYAVSDTGGAGSLYYVSTMACGVRPVMHIDSSRTSLYYYAGTVSSNGAVSEVAIPSNNATANNGAAANKHNSPSFVSAASPKKAKIKKVKAAGRRALKITIKRDKNASGYQIQYSINKKFKKKKTKAVNIKKNKTTTKTLKKLKSGKKYYIRVRSYKKVRSGNSVMKVYGNWSKTIVSKKVR